MIISLDADQILYIQLHYWDIIWVIIIKIHFMVNGSNFSCERMFCFSCYCFSIKISLTPGLINKICTKMWLKNWEQDVLSKRICVISSFHRRSAIIFVLFLILWISSKKMCIMWEKEQERIWTLIRSGKLGRFLVLTQTTNIDTVA